MTPTTAIQTCFRKYVTVSDRAGRSEFIWFALFCVAVFAVLYGKGLEARAVSDTNPIGQFVLWSRSLADTLFYLLVVPLMLLPTGFAQKFSFFSITENEITQ